MDNSTEDYRKKMRGARVLQNVSKVHTRCISVGPHTIQREALRHTNKNGICIQKEKTILRKSIHPTLKVVRNMSDAKTAVVTTMHPFFLKVILGFLGAAAYVNLTLHFYH